MLGFFVLLILIVNDWWKRRLVRKAQQQQRVVRPELQENVTDWRMVGSLAVGFIVLAYVMSHPEWANKDLGPIKPLIKWLVGRPR